MLLLACDCGRISGALTLFFCAPCASIRCTHPSCSSATADAGVCTRCLRGASAAEFSRNFGRCATCTTLVSGVLTQPPDRLALVTALRGAGVAAAINTTTFPTRACAAGVPPPQRSLLACESAVSSASSAAGGWNDLANARALIIENDVEMSTSITRTQDTVLLLPPLLSVPTRRCCTCVRASRAGILYAPIALGAPSVAPETLAALRLYRKESPAAAILPWVTLLVEGWERGKSSGGGGVASSIGNAPPRPSDAARDVLHAARVAAKSGARSLRIKVLFSNPNSNYFLGIIFGKQINKFITKTADGSGGGDVDSLSKDAWCGVVVGDKMAGRSTSFLGGSVPTRVHARVMLDKLDAALLIPPSRDNNEDNDEDGGGIIPPPFPWPSVLHSDGEGLLSHVPQTSEVLLNATLEWPAGWGNRIGEANGDASGDDDGDEVGLLAQLPQAVALISTDELNELGGGFESGIVTSVSFNAAIILE